MFGYAGRTAVFAAALIVAAGSGVFVSCGSSLTGDGIFNYALPPQSEDVATLIPVPVKREYPVKSEFNRFKDLSVMAVHSNGETTPVPIEKVDIRIGEGGEETHLGTGASSLAYVFEDVGEKIVNLEYAKQKARYAVWVRGSANDDPGGGSSGSNGGGGAVIIINVIE
ncbi:MAG: hypothetical protein LBG14_05925 [Treponema sp.]|jgi:hypothetical protein|nr:hypothetical protein [Treponema sp.]